MSNVHEALDALPVLTRQGIEDEALRWLLELNGSEPSVDRWLEFDAWLSEHPDHEEIYGRFEENSRRLQMYGFMQRAASTGVFVGRRASRFAVAAIVLVSILAVLVAAGRSGWFEMQRQFGVATIATSAYESKQRTLDNGVVVLLGARTTLQVESGEQHGRVRLLEGEAIFDVPANLKEPFEVSTDLVDATAVEPAKFAVVIDTTVSVHVHEGVINISFPGASKGAPVIVLRRGQSYHATMAEAPPAVAKVDARTSSKLAAG